MAGKKPRHGHDRNDDDEHEGEIVKRVPKPKLEEVLENGEEVMSHVFDGGAHTETHTIHKWNGYYVYSGAECAGPFKTLSAAAHVEDDSIFTLTSASTEITCTELTAKQLAKRLNCENIEEYEDFDMDDDVDEGDDDDRDDDDDEDSNAFKIILNGEVWVLMDGSFHKTSDNTPNDPEETDELPDEPLE